MMSRPLHFLVLLPVLAGLIGCAPGDSGGSAADQTAIRGMLNAYVRALNEGDLEAVVASYTEDGVLLPSQGPAQVGREALRAFYGRMMER